ncbi:MULTISPECIES: D-alanyl-D-alanine carboxypeptidase family protein [Staphylococcus]|uniref:D-alanyl-D-alanine carboxypeptidase n=3 Tax=Staphylococcus TaxID=1279 RepID=A0A380HM08_STASA|nr:MULTISPECIES: M15 family metallopeptidase [Staphylococcus]KIJ86946.1 D-Ala-D-Ala carboxypeptidase [Staphylococcus saprophyticus]MBF2753358.1 M15 family metallopeptidase [Staphylococcus saprophyticus]MBF2781544.1 M15 family metallopeptidase [Staphylococcus saprophyticus]MCC4221538.1 M15 family metallopeptidase [Staphylococcus saprophyticus]MDL1995046.1 M15 family metallopeptidase [Staphylococcus saprophyticus]
MSKKVMLFLFTLVCLCLIVIFIMILSANNFKPTNDNIGKPKNALPLKYENNGVTYVNGHVIVNKQLALPAKYKPGENKIAKKQLNKLLKQAEKRNLDLTMTSGYRNFENQEKVVDTFVEKDGKQKTTKYAAKPGHSEHQTGLAFDVGTSQPLNDFHTDFEKTKEAQWLAKHAANYGFIIRYPKNQSKQTGYAYEPWHLRYVGPQLAKTINEKNTNLESYYHLNK